MTYFLKELGKAFIVGCAIYVVFLAIHLLGGGGLEFNAALAEDFGISMLYSVVLYLLNIRSSPFSLTNTKLRFIPTIIW